MAWLLDAVARDLVRSTDIVASVISSVTTGVSPQDPQPGSFYGYFHRPEELRDKILAAGFGAVDIVAVEGFAHLFPDVNERLDDPDSREPLLGLLRRYEREPAVVGISSHLLAISHRPRGTGS